MSDQAAITEAGAHNLGVEAVTKEPLKISDPRVALRVYQQYLGVLTLLGHALARKPVDSMQQYRAFTDANNVLKALGSEIRYRPGASGGWAAFQETPDAPAASKNFRAGR